MIKELSTTHYTKNYRVFKDTTSGDIYLKSYNSWVAKFTYDGMTLSLGRDWDYSSTTKRHIQWFLREIIHIPYSTEELREMVSNGYIQIYEFSPYSEDSIYRIR